MATGYSTASAGTRPVEESDWLRPREPPIRYRRNTPTAWLELMITEGRNWQLAYPAHDRRRWPFDPKRMMRLAIG